MSPGISTEAPPGGAAAADSEILGVANADQTVVNNSTVLAALTNLGVPIGASPTEVWLAEYLLEFLGNATADAKLGYLALPAGASVRWGPVTLPTAFGGYGVTSTASAALALNTTGTVSIGLGAVASGVPIIAKIFGGGTAGTAQLAAAQVVADPSDLVLQRASCVRYRKLLA